jgi:hypothetical protein
MTQSTRDLGSEFAVLADHAIGFLLFFNNASGAGAARSRVPCVFKKLVPSQDV